MTVLITGGTGFLGSYLTRYALGPGGEDHVVLLDRYVDRARIADVLDRVTVIEGDVGDAALVQAAVGDYGVDRIAHFAFILGSPGPGAMPDYVRACCQGTANVMEAARTAGVRRLVFASSVAAYGETDADLLTEDMLSAPAAPYGFFKLWAEAMVNHYARDNGVDGVSLRFGSTYGLGRAFRGSYASGLMAVPSGSHYLARVEDVLAGRPVTLPGGDDLIDFTYAADAAQAAWLALTAPRPSFRLYNVSSGRQPVRRFAEALAAILPEATIAVDPAEPVGHAHAPMDNARLIGDLGFVPAYDIAAGIADYVERVRIAQGYHASPPD